MGRLRLFGRSAPRPAPALPTPAWGWPAAPRADDLDAPTHPLVVAPANHGGPVLRGALAGGAWEAWPRGVPATSTVPPGAWPGDVSPSGGTARLGGVPAAVPGFGIPGPAVAGGEARPESGQRPDPAEAGALAGAFAVDYLSWDEDDPGRRGRVLRDYLRPPAGDPALLGWSGTGRQRGEFALPGLVRPDGEGRVLVDVRVRVTPYRAVGERTPDGATSVQPDCGLAGVPAVAPAPTGRGWRSLASCWVRLSVPITNDGGRLVVDAWEETIGLEAPVGRPAPGSTDHALVDDDPLTRAAE